MTSRACFGTPTFTLINVTLRIWWIWISSTGMFIGTQKHCRNFSNTLLQEPCREPFFLNLFGTAMLGTFSGTHQEHLQIPLGTFPLQESFQEPQSLFRNFSQTQE